MTKTMKRKPQLFYQSIIKVEGCDDLMESSTEIPQFREKSTVNYLSRPTNQDVKANITSAQGMTCFFR